MGFPGRVKTGVKLGGRHHHTGIKGLFTFLRRGLEKVFTRQPGDMAIFVDLHQLDKQVAGHGMAGTESG